MDLNKAYDYGAMFIKDFANKQILVYCTLFPVPVTVLSNHGNWIHDTPSQQYKNKK